MLESLAGPHPTPELQASRVRRKLCVGADDRFVVSVWGVGYRLLD